jgi:putative oxidoreductase
MKFLVPVGRVLYSLIFIQTALFHFSDMAVGYASSQGVPMAGILVPFSGILATLGGLSILLGFKARWGAVLIILFLIPVTFTMHAFWKLEDPAQQQMQMSMFMKNISMLGAAFLIAWFGAGPVSLDERIDRNKRQGS